MKKYGSFSAYIFLKMKIPLNSDCYFNEMTLYFWDLFLVSLHIIHYSLYKKHTFVSEQCFVLFWIDNAFSSMYIQLTGGLLS